MFNLCDSVRFQWPLDSTLQDRDRLISLGCYHDAVLSFQRYMGSHFGIVSEELEYPKDVAYYTSDIHHFDSHRELIRSL